MRSKGMALLKCQEGADAETDIDCTFDIGGGFARHDINYIRTEYVCRSSNAII